MIDSVGHVILEVEVEIVTTGVTVARVLVILGEHVVVLTGGWLSFSLIILFKVWLE